ncbi:MAG: sugar ABC transporter substrate-binding protein [Anaerolineae bacterium]|nr:sugar ABC transporter substrate-binding protein [Anaerolineae bacterium]
MKNIRVYSPVLWAAIVITVVALAVIGCATPPAGAPQVVRETVVVPQTVVIPAEPAAKSGPIVVGYSPPTLEMTDFYKFGELGLQQKAKELGENLVVITKAPSSHQAAEDQLRIVEDFITLGVDYIWIVPISAEAAPPMVKAANEAGIPIIVSHSLEPIEGVDVTAYVGTDFKETGTLVGEWVCDFVKGEGTVAILQGDPGFYNDARVGTAIDVLKSKCPNVKVITGEYTQWDTQKALNSTSALLNANPDIKLIYAPAAPLTLGVVEAVEKAGLTGKVAVVDYDLIPATIKLAKEGKVVAGLGLRPWVYGEETAQVIKDLQDGKQIEKVHNVPGKMSTAAEIDSAYPEWYINYGQ